VNHFFWLIPIFYGPCWVIRLKFQPSGNIDYSKLQGKGGAQLGLETRAPQNFSKKAVCLFLPNQIKMFDASDVTSYK
jgi:hypothetical protein